MTEVFENFNKFKADFMDKIGKNLPWAASAVGVNKIVITQTRETARRNIDTGWYDVRYPEWSENFDSLRREIVDAVGFFYFNGKKISNRFINASIGGGIDTEWISEIEEDCYTDYYDSGDTQTLTIQLDKLFDIIQNCSSIQ